jgi:hypothetical protein
MIIGVRAAPKAHEVTGQKEFGKCASEMLNRSFIARGALVITAALKPTMKQLQSCQLKTTAKQMPYWPASGGGMRSKDKLKEFENACNADIATHRTVSLLLFSTKIRLVRATISLASAS